MAKAKLNLIETELAGHLFVEPPPKSFQPLRATDEELEKYGLPHRPDPKKSPRASIGLLKARNCRVSVLATISRSQIIECFVISSMT